MTRNLRLAGAAVTILGVTISGGGPTRADAPAATAAGAPVDLVTLSRSFEGLADRVIPAVVQIFALGWGPGAGGQQAADLLDRQENTGSGVIVDPAGWIVTNAHVVEGARRVQVLLPPTPEDVADRGSILKGRGTLVGAQVVGLDRETDLAVLRISKTGLPALALADSDELRPGQLVFAFGSPLGLASSVSMGVVSATARQFGPENPMIYIQSDATINPGNSGGPLVNSRGDVVGINTFILSRSGGSEGVGFAAPSNIVRNVYRQIRESGRVRRGEIGVHAQTITPVLADALGLQVSYGVILGDVYPTGAADRAGLRIGDLIVALDGKPMENGRQLDVNLYRRPIGSRVTLEVLRGGQRRIFDVEVTERQDDTLRFDDLVAPDRNLVSELGILGVDLSPKLLEVLPTLRVRTGVLVASRVSGNPYPGEGFEPGDVIHRVNAREVTNLGSLRKALGELPGGAPLAVQVERRGRMMYLALERR